jgi:hypothetical protein
MTMHLSFFSDVVAVAGMLAASVAHSSPLLIQSSPVGFHSREYYYYGWFINEAKT